MDSEDLMPAVSDMEPELELGPRRKPPESRLVWRRTQLLPGVLTALPSADLLVDEWSLDEADLMSRGEGWVLGENCERHTESLAADLCLHL